MTTITIDDRTKKGKCLVEFLCTLEGEGFVKIEKEPTASLMEAIYEAKAGKVKECRNTEDLFKKLRKKANV